MNTREKFDVLRDFKKHDRELAEYLLQTRRLNLGQLMVAAKELTQSSKPLYTHLVSLGFMFENEMRDIRAELLKIPALDLSLVKPSPAALKMLPAALAIRHRVLPMEIQQSQQLLPGVGAKPILPKQTAQQILLAVEATEDMSALDQISAYLHTKGITSVKLGLATTHDLQREIDRVYGERVTVDSLLLTHPNGEVPAQALLEAILQDAFDQEASDVHFEPEKRFLRVRIRVDGVLREVHMLHASVWPALVVRLKVLSNMNIAESRAPQDGRFQIHLGNYELNFRVACLPTTHGENFVLRLLDDRKSIVPLSKLGLAEHTMARLQSLLKRPEGMILVTGPTGSGKTTTLYSMLSQINQEEINIMTLEDPVEYPLPLIRQSQVSEKLDFANGVRALMRQDPDVILVGEIRDTETAQIALRAAMTGHQVFATLHTNSALSAVQRLCDIGVPSSTLAGNLIGVLGQRLVRRLCSHCKLAYCPSEAEMASLGLHREKNRTDGLHNSSEEGNDPILYRPGGCSVCREEGYIGRTALLEVLVLDEGMDALIANMASPPELARQARLSGFISLRDDAIRRVLAGETSIEEAARVVSL
jgi:type II secretory ATPase GspE/PulE/Tfp pilus assembly ATPase PilB-like protein